MTDTFALISVTDTTGIVDLAKFIGQHHKILASDGTAQLLQDSGVDAIKISNYTGFPELLSGRVKTLHPKIHAGILAENTSEHLSELEELNITKIDIVVCNLYRFVEALNQNPREENVIAHIDIGGVTLIRAAAKNYQNVVVLVDPTDYLNFMGNYPNLIKGDKLHLASKAFSFVTHYDIEISKYMNKISEATESFFESKYDQNYFIGGSLIKKLRYGENPHQQAAYYSSNDQMFFHHLGGPNLSYNNILDLSTGFALVSDFEDPSCVIIKHRTPCGVASGPNLATAFQSALETDKMSAYGGVYCFNGKIDVETARELIKMFVDVIFAIDYDDEAILLLLQKEKMKILKHNPGEIIVSEIAVVPAGFVVQERDFNKLSNDQIHMVSIIKPDDNVLDELKFAWTVVKHSKSNAIVVSTKTQAIGIGSGQTSRVEAVKHAISQAGEKTRGSVLASDAFFPFPDSIELAAKAGIKAIIVPKGSIRDEEVIQTANKLGIILVFTKIRAFKH